MAYVPKDAEWFLADLVLEFKVAGSKRNVVHVNHVIIHARSPEAAYARAMSIGKRSAVSYDNPHGKKVTIRFRCLSNLDVIYDPLGDECEVMYREKLGVSEKAIRKMVRAKRKLEVFMPIRECPGRPDFSSGEIMREVKKAMKVRADEPASGGIGVRRVKCGCRLVDIPLMFGCGWNCRMLRWSKFFELSRD